MKFISEQKAVLYGQIDQYVDTESEILCELETPSPCSNYRDEYNF